MRALLFASLGRGVSHLHHLLNSPDTDAMVTACRGLGARLEHHQNALAIEGTGGQVALQGELDCGNSGQVLRFVAALGALGERPFRITGDASIRSRRPVHALIEALQQGGVNVSSEAGRPPLGIQGPLRPGLFRLEGSDSQPVSAMLMACSFLAGPSTLLVRDLGERPWIGLTVWWLRRLGASIEWHEEGTQDRFEVAGGWTPPPIDQSIPGDWSSAAFPILAALLAGTSTAQPPHGVTLEGLVVDDPQGDRLLAPLLQGMGGQLHWRGQTLHVCRSTLQGGCFDGNHIIDAVPILAAAAPFMQKGIRIENVAVARRKESDRLEAMGEGLTRLGGRVTLGADWIEVAAGPLHGGEVSVHDDHRIAMALSVAALGASAPVTLKDCACVAKSYPGFFCMMRDLGVMLTQQCGHQAHLITHPPHPCL